jgi:hypothetical protein
VYCVVLQMRTTREHVFIAVVCAVLGGCASVGPPLPPSLELPKPPVDLHAARKGDKVTLTWTVPARTTDRRSVRYLGITQICRGLDPVLEQCGKPVGEAAPAANLRAVKKMPTKLGTSYVDTLPPTMELEHSAGFATYAVEVLNTAGRGAGLSNQVHVALVPTLPPFPDFSAKVVPNGVFISWRCIDESAPKPSGVKYLFRIYRRAEGGTTQSKIDDSWALCLSGSDASHVTVDLPAEGIHDFASSFLDRTFEWEKTYYYRGTLVSVVAVPGKPPVEVEGDDTPEVRVFADDVFPPAVPTGLQAVFSGPGQQPFIDLVWIPVTDADLAGYNVYRRAAGTSPEKLNSELVNTPAFRDTKIAPGEEYFYSVSAVDVRGNESARSEETSERSPRIAGRLLKDGAF